MAVRPWSEKRWRWLIVPGAFGVAAGVMAAVHSTFSEFDGLMQLTSGKHLIAHGTYLGWASHFWPPLYALLASSLGKAVGQFTAAKTISILAALLMLAVTYHVTLLLTEDKKLSLLAQLMLAINPLFFLNAFQAQNHLLDAALASAAVWMLLLCVRRKSLKLLFAAGALTGLAASTRYTSYAIVPVAAFCVWHIAEQNARRAKAFGVYLLGLFALAGPWLVQNAVLNGSPFASWQYMNIGSAYIEPLNNYGRWWWHTQAQFHGLGNVISHNPRAYLLNVLHNLWGSIPLLFGAAGAMAVFIPLLFWRQRSDKGKDKDKDKKLFQYILLLVAVAELLLISQAFLRDYLFLIWSMIATVLGMAAFKRLAGKFARFKNPVIATLVIAGVALTSIATSRFLGTFNSGSVTDVANVTAVLTRAGANASSRVMAVHPIYSFEAGTAFVMAPLYYRGSLDDYLHYRRIPQLIRDYAPRSPVMIADSRLGADFLVFNKALGNYVPQFRFLLTAPQNKLPPMLQVLWRSKSTAVFKVLD
ncbi:MAG: glycosyltransferase family 39 protein [Actinomycetota bacterium]